MEKKKISRWAGIIVFVIAETVYLFTLEPTTSYWDCPEFITCANKLEVGHAPGAPVFMLLGRFFSLFAGNNLSKIALMVNALSATASALTVVFLFYIIVWFVKKLLARCFSDLSAKNTTTLLYGAAFIGAITYAFTDSFWFSAVEGEVYATSSLFSALVFWCILKWEETYDKGYGKIKWIYLLFFLLGLSVGIHLLNMLALPAIVLVYYSKRFKITMKRFVISQFVSLSLLLFFVFFIIPGVAKSAAYTDLFFVNTVGLPVYSGGLAFVLTLAVVLRLMFLYFRKKQKKALVIATVAFSFWLVGYSSFSVLVVRSGANPFVDINNVENLFGLVDYLNREQYPTRPLIKGNNYNSPVIDYKKRYTYKLYDGKYHKDELNPDYIFDKSTLTLFPRMASLDPGHEQFYKKWVKIKGRRVKTRTSGGESKVVLVPTLLDNISFFLRYQLGHMYLRYFMWNFSGKQNDIQGLGGRLHGNWISGVPFIDTLKSGPQEKMPDKFKEHKARNVYFMLPLFLGLVGMFYHYKKDRVNFGTVFLLFLMTGVAIVLYLNEIPVTPRERDYAYVGSFMAFCIWISVGIIALFRSVKRLLNNKVWIWAVLITSFVLVPLNMFMENFDDHNRSERTMARDFALNTLNTMDPNAMFFTNGDNDTYPIWYMQEVENVRPDIRHVLFSFLSMDWYANQLQQTWQSKKGVKVSYSGTELLMSKNSYFPVIRKYNNHFDTEEVIQFLKSPDKSSKVQLTNGNMVDYLPSGNLSLKVNEDKFLTSCSYARNYEGEIPSHINFTINKDYLNRADILLLDILTRNKWERPVYFASPQTLDNLGLKEYLHREGNVYRLLPFKNRLPEKLNREQALIQYELITRKFKWGNIDKEKVFLDNTCMNSIQSFRYHLMFAELAGQLKEAGELEKAVEILDICMDKLPEEKISYNVFSPQIVEAYYLLNETEKGDKLAENIITANCKLFEYCRFLPGKGNVSAKTDGEIDLAMYIVSETLKLTSRFSKDLFRSYSDTVQEYYSLFYMNS